jgi:hypothetical protein
MYPKGNPTKMILMLIDTNGRKSLNEIDIKQGVDLMRVMGTLLRKGVKTQS